MARKEQIYTIPVNDAFAQKQICPICELREKRTQQLLEYYLGPSLMEPDNRIETNEKGFCNKHYEQLYASQQNRLGLGLITHTYMKTQRDKIEKIMDKAKTEDAGFFTFKKNAKDNLNDAADEMDQLVDSCALCDKLNKTMENYMDVIFFNFSDDPDFAKKFYDIVPFCLSDVALLFQYAGKFLKKAELNRFVDLVEEIELEKMDQLIDEVEWFTWKFDYRYKDKPWGNSRSAIYRAINFLTGLQENVDREQENE